MRDSTARETNWPQHRLTDLAHYHNGVAFKPADWSMDGLPIIRIEQLNNPEGEFDRYTGPVAEVNHIQDGDLVFSWSATLKVVIWRHGDGVLNQHLFKVVPKPGFDASFIYFLLDQSMEALGNGSHGSTMKHIKRSELDKFTARVPPLAKQQKIAAILTSLDTAIEKTEALIEKHQQIKAGLMHDLFTRGVLPHGQLRPPREQAADQYVVASMGWIPKSWKVEPLSNRVHVVDPNPSHRYPPPVPEGVPLASTENFLGEGDFQLDGATQVPEETFVAQNERCHFRPMDVVFARKGKIGLARRYGKDRKVFSHTVVILKPSDVQTDAPWLVWAARSAWLLNHIDRTMNSNSGVPTLGVDFIKKVPMPFPPRDEQAAIASQLDKASEVLGASNQELRKLRQKKLGLMQDLLTGKVPVKIADTAAVPA